jgi:hypothetical protein
MENFQSAPKRAWADFRKWLFGHIVAYVIGFIAPLAATLFLAWLLPLEVSFRTSAFWGLVFGVSVLTLMFGFGYLWQLVLAPIRQRNEIRNLLSSRPRTIPIPNRDELIRTIANIEKATIDVFNKQDVIKTIQGTSGNTRVIMGDTSLDDRERAIDVFNDAMNSLRREYLVSGTPYDKIALEFTNFIWMNVAAKTGKLRLSPTTPQPIHLGNTLEFGKKLEAHVKLTVEKINEAYRQSVSS